MKYVITAICAMALCGCNSSINSRSAMLAGNVGPIGCGAGVIVDGQVKAVPNAVIVAAYTEPAPAVGKGLTVKKYQLEK